MTDEDNPPPSQEATVAALATASEGGSVASRQTNFPTAAQPGLRDRELPNLRHGASTCLGFAILHPAAPIRLAALGGLVTIDRIQQAASEDHALRFPRTNEQSRTAEFAQFKVGLEAISHDLCSIQEIVATHAAQSAIKRKTMLQPSIDQSVLECLHRWRDHHGRIEKRLQLWPAA